MTIIKQLELEAVVFVIIGAMVGAFFVNQARTNQSQFHSLTNLPANAADPTPTPTPFVPEVTSSSQTSSDGTKKVTVKVTTNKDLTRTYDILTSDNDGSNEHAVISKKLDAKKSISIPFNTWSPNNNYFFIQENTEADPLIMVFTATGEPFADGEAYLDATDAFAKQATENQFGQATGWASETLIFINSVLPDKTKGPTYWFEVPSKAVIQLSTRFY